MHLLGKWIKEPREVAQQKSEVDDVIILDSYDKAGLDSSKNEEELFNVELSLKPHPKESKENVMMLANQPTNENENMPKKKTTRSRISKMFGNTTRRNKKSTKKSEPITKMLIAVDEKEKHMNTDSRKINSRSLISDSLALSRKNSKISQLSRPSKRSGKSKLAKKSPTRNNINVPRTQSSQRKPYTPIRSTGSSLSNIVPVPQRPNNKKAETVLNFSLSLDAVGGISCINYGNKAQGDPPTVLISYFIQSNETGNIKRYDIESLPIQRIHSPSDKELYDATFEDNDDMGGNNLFTVAVGMTRNKKKSSGFDMKEFYIQVGLKKGSEIIKLGNAIVSLNGDEAGVRKSVPLGDIKFITSFTGNKKRVSKVSKMIVEGLEPVSFPSDPKKRYALEKSHLSISSVRVDLNHYELSSMVVFPSIDEKISGLSYDGAVQEPEVNRSKKNIHRNFQSSMVELLNLNSNSTSEEQLSRSDHYDIGRYSSSGEENDESTIVFNNNFHENALLKAERHLTTLDSTSSEEMASSYNSADESDFESHSSIYESDVNSSANCSTVDSEDYLDALYSDDSIESYLDDVESD